MAAKKKKRALPEPDQAEPSRIHEATLESGASGSVIKGMGIDETAAIARRQSGEDIVICGESLRANRRLACQVETAIGPCERQEPHVHLAGLKALPHFQQTDQSHKGHTFYETDNRKARVKR